MVFFFYKDTLATAHLGTLSTDPDTSPQLNGAAERIKSALTKKV
jgi:hypothetical protein